MAFQFPADKNDFKAPNGITYTYVDNKWVVKSFGSSVEIPDAQEPLRYMLQTDKVLRSTAEDPDPLVPVFVGPAAIELVDTEGYFSNVKIEGQGPINVESTASSIVIDADMTEINALKETTNKHQHEIDNLGVTKGKVARYTAALINSVPTVSRAGELGFNYAEPALVTLVSFGTMDADDILTKPMAVNDIIEFVDAENGNVSRFKVVDSSGAPTLVAVEHISGDNNFAVGEEEQVYIYPQNASGPSKEYVDEQDDLKLNKNGDTITGDLIIDPASGSLTTNNAASLLINGSPELLDTGSIFDIRTGANGGLGSAKQAFYVANNGSVGASRDWQPTLSNHLTTKEYVDEAIGLGGAIVEDYLPKAGGVMTGELHFDRGDGGGNLMIYPNVGTADTSIYALNNSTLRFRTVAGTNQDSGERKTHIAISKDPVTQEPVTNIYHLADPTSSLHAANKQYVDNAVSGASGVGNYSRDLEDRITKLEARIAQLEGRDSFK